MIHIEIAKRDTIESFVEFRRYFNHRVKLADLHHSQEKNQGVINSIRENYRDEVLKELAQ